MMNSSANSDIYYDDFYYMKYFYVHVPEEHMQLQFVAVADTNITAPLQVLLISYYIHVSFIHLRTRHGLTLFSFCKSITRFPANCIRTS